LPVTASHKMILPAQFPARILPSGEYTSAFAVPSWRKRIVPSLATAPAGNGSP